MRIQKRLVHVIDNGSLGHFFFCNSSAVNFIIKFQNYVHFNSGMSATCVITVCVCVYVCD